MASNAKALSFLSGDLSLSGTEVSINVAGSVQSDSITGSTITMKNTGSTIVASDGSTAVLSENGGAVTLTADEANVGSNALVVDSSGNVGIGTSSPQDGLDVAKNARIGQGQISSDSTVGVLGIYGGLGPSSTNSQLRFFGRSISNTGLTYEIARISGSSFGPYSLSGGIQFSTASNDGANNLTLTERMRIDSSGNVGIGGVTDPKNPLHITDKRNYTYSSTADSTTNMAGLRLTNSNNFDNWVGIWFATGGIEGTHWSGIAGARTNNAATWGTHLSFFTHEDAIVNISQATERMRIDSSGNLLVGTTTSQGRLTSVPKSGFFPSNTASTWATSAAIGVSGSFGGGVSWIDGSAGYCAWVDDNGNDFNIAGGGTGAVAAGGVYLDNYHTQWSARSDERDKINLEPITDAATKIKSLRTVIGEYSWAEGVRHPFLIAQDVQQVLPEAVSIANKSAPEEEQRLGLSYTDIVPLLTAALQESIALIESQQFQIDTLTTKTQEQDLTIASLISRIEALENA